MFTSLMGLKKPLDEWIKIEEEELKEKNKILYSLTMKIFYSYCVHIKYKQSSI